MHNLYITLEINKNHGAGDWHYVVRRGDGSKGYCSGWGETYLEVLKKAKRQTRIMYENIVNKHKKKSMWDRLLEWLLYWT